MGNEHLRRAREVKDDEYYTFYDDVEKECENYKEFFAGKVIYCPADKENSNFFKYFFTNFTTLGLKKLIATNINSKYAVVKDEKRKLSYEEMDGEGDFLSDTISKYLKEADIVVTNPPFSLFRRFALKIMGEHKDFLMIANENASTSRDLFSFVKENIIRFGFNNIKEFQQPDGSNKKFGNICWLTTLPILKNNLFVPTKEKLDTVQWYDNYEAVEVGKIKDIPRHCDYIMGVPQTYLKVQNSSLYEIMGIACGTSKTTKSYGDVPYTEGFDDHGGNPIIEGKRKYTRIFIRERAVEI